jgi:hypothetical protein
MLRRPQGVIQDFKHGELNGRMHQSGLHRMTAQSEKLYPNFSGAF